MRDSPAQMLRSDSAFEVGETFWKIWQISRLSYTRVLSSSSPFRRRAARGSLGAEGGGRRRRRKELDIKVRRRNLRRDSLSTRRRLKTTCTLSCVRKAKNMGAILGPLPRSSFFCLPPVTQQWASPQYTLSLAFGSSAGKGGNFLIPWAGIFRGAQPLV